MPQEDDGASELNHPEEILWVVFPANDYATIVMKPSEQPLDFPATMITPQHAAASDARAVNVQRRHLRYS